MTTPLELIPSSSSSNSTKTDAEDDEDDPVVQELPLVINPALAKELILAQYPTVPSYRKDRMTRKVSARVRPKSMKMEIEFAFENEKGEESTFWYKSEEIEKRGNYYATCVRDGMVVLNPISHILRFTPSFDRRNKESDDRMDANEQNATNVKDEATPVPVQRGAGQELSVEIKSERISRSKSRRDRSGSDGGDGRGQSYYAQSYYSYQQAVEKDEWVDLEIHDRESAQGRKLWEQFSVPSVTTKPKDVKWMTPSEYMDALSTIKKKKTVRGPTTGESMDVDDDKTVEEDDSNAIMSRKQRVDFFLQGERRRLDRTRLTHMSVSQRVEMIMMYGRVVKFDTVADIVRRGDDTLEASRQDVTDRDILSALERVAVCVRGSFVLKSELAVSEDDPLVQKEVKVRQTQTGAYVEYERHCRDIIVSTFETSPTNMCINVVSDLNAAEDMKFLRPHRVKVYLRELAQRVKIPGSTTRGWIFREDDHTESLYARFSGNERETFESRARDMGENAHERLEEFHANGLPETDGTKSRQNVMILRPWTSTVRRREKPKEITLDQNAIRRRLVKASPEKLKAHEGLVSALTKILAEGVTSKAYMTAHLRALGLINDDETKINDVLDLIAMQIPGIPLYVLRNTEDAPEKREIDELRCVVCEQFGSTNMLRRKDVKEAITKVYGEKTKHLSGARYSKAMQEFAVSSGNRWSLKNGSRDGGFYDS